MTDVYRIPRVEITAQVALGGNQVRQVALFLGATAETHLGPERPSDLLNAARPFLPAMEHGQVVFLNLDAVLLITVPAELEFSADEIALLDAALLQQTHRRVRIHLEDGSTVCGDLTYLQPAGQRRIQDFLNGKEWFFALRDGDQARLVNKRRIAWLTTE